MSRRRKASSSITMLFWTHIAFGILAGLCSIRFLSPKNQILFIIIAVIASVLPDIDSPRSRLGKKVKIIGWIFEHRGIFHSFFAVALLSALFFMFSRSYIYTAAFFIGYLSHIIIDSITLEGTAIFYPLSKFRLRAFVRTGGLLEMIILVIILALDVMVLLKIG